MRFDGGGGLREVRDLAAECILRLVETRGLRLQRRLPRVQLLLFLVQVLRPAFSFPALGLEAPRLAREMRSVGLELPSRLPNLLFVGP